MNITVEQAPPTPVTITWRDPEWSRETRARRNGEDLGPGTELTGRWQAGDTVEITLDMTPRVIQPDHRIDAVRGCVAILRGPEAQALESRNLPAGRSREDALLTGVPTPSQARLHRSRRATPADPRDRQVSDSSREGKSGSPTRPEGEQSSPPVGHRPGHSRDRRPGDLGSRFTGCVRRFCWPGSAQCLSCLSKRGVPGPHPR